jgi:multidrug efflux pump subunit AcrA (membrane-fusion protein)
VDSYPSRDFPGIVQSISPKATIVSGIVNYEVTIDINKDAHLLKPDMTANVSIETAQHEAILLPSKTVQHDGEQTFVCVLTPNGPQRKPVVIGAKQGESVEIKTGIWLGDEILLMPAETKNQPESSDR